MADINLRHLPETLHRDLKIIAAKRGVSLKWLLVTALERLVAEEQRTEAKEAK